MVVGKEEMDEKKFIEIKKREENEEEIEEEVKVK